VIDEAGLLSLWEQGHARRPLDRALLLLWACTGSAGGATLPLGQRDAALLRARIALFGATLEATAPCPHCGNQLAFALPLQQLADAAPAAAVDTTVDCAGGRFRLPTSADIAQAMSAAEPRRALALALRVDAAGAVLDERTVAELEAALAAADPAAQLDIALQCDACGAAFAAPFDAAECLWLDVQARARSTLDEVHQLASAYGWSEAEVLAVPPARRHHYLQRVLA
jgi:hypothetical protein